LADPRFPPVRQEELSALNIEISLLSPPEPIRPEQIEIGRHGLLVVSAPPLVSKGEPSVKRGLLLPQVAIEHGLTAEQFLDETCRKADLSADSWRHLAAAASLGASSSQGAVARHADSAPADAFRVQLFAFTCQVFSESAVDCHP
jgi:AMMECR1 domain-containing protein